MDLATRPAVDKVTSLAEVNRLLHDTLLRERALESKVEALFQGRDAHVSSFDRLDAETTEVHSRKCLPSVILLTNMSSDSVASSCSCSSLPRAMQRALQPACMALQSFQKESVRKCEPWTLRKRPLRTLSPTSLGWSVGRARSRECRMRCRQAT